MRLGLFGRAKQTIAVVVNPWQGVWGYYVGMYRRYLDQIADILSERGKCSITTRFNSDSKCAEFVDSKGYIIARVNVHGSECCPYQTIVRTNLPDEFKTLFKELIPGKVRFEELEAT